MSRPPRNKDPSLYRLITIRTEEARLFMRPSKDVNKILGGVLARYSEIFQIDIFAYHFLSNHKHLLIKAPHGNTDEFEENVNREIARRINWKLHRSGNFWSRRYDDQVILTENDLLEGFLYVTTNSTRHGLVEHPSQWPGLCSYRQSIKEDEARFPFFHYSARDNEEKVTYHTLKLTPLPQFADLSKSERVKEVKDLIEARTQALVKARREDGGGFLGAEAVKAQDPFERPRNISRSPRPYCYTKSVEIRREFRAQERLRRHGYAEASIRYRLGNLEIEFPQFSFKPPLHRKPRLSPFKELPEDFFKKAA